MWLSVKVPKGVYDLAEQERIMNAVDTTASDHLQARMRKPGVPVREIHLMETNRPQNDRTIYVTYMNDLKIENESAMQFVNAFLSDCADAVIAALGRTECAVVASTTLLEGGPRHERACVKQEAVA